MILKVGDHSPQIHPTAFIHPTAEVSGKVKIGARSSVWGYCVLRGDVDSIEIGDDCNIQDASVLHTSPNFPVKLGKGVTVGHKATIHGAVIGNYCLIGMDAILLDGSVVEENCLIGAGALLKENGRIPKGQLALGFPAKPVRALTFEEIAVITKRADEYVQLAAQYKAALAKQPQ